MHPRNLGAHLNAQARVEVRERLVHQEHARVADDRAPHRDALALAARELTRLALQQVCEPERLAGCLDAAPDLAFRRPTRAQPEGDVLEHRHVGVERVVLEHHRDVAAARVEVADAPLADEDLALGDLLETGDHRSAVVLPQPDGPTSTMNSPSVISSEKSRSAVTPS